MIFGVQSFSLWVLFNLIEFDGGIGNFILFCLLLIFLGKFEGKR